MSSDKDPVDSSLLLAKSAGLRTDTQLEFIFGEPDNCDCGISSAPIDNVEYFDDEPDNCECEIWDEEKKRAWHAEVLRELSADLDASQDPSRAWQFGGR